MSSLGTNFHTTAIMKTTRNARPTVRHPSLWVPLFSIVNPINPESNQSVVTKSSPSQPDTSSRNTVRRRALSIPTNPLEKEGTYKKTNIATYATKSKNVLRRVLFQRLLSNVIRRATAPPRMRQTKIGSISNYGFPYSLLSGILLILGYLEWGFLERSDPRGIALGMIFLVLGFVFIFFSFKQIFPSRPVQKDIH